jgi:hypothetical protein
MITRSVRNVLVATSIGALALGVGAQAQGTREQPEPLGRQPVTPTTPASRTAARPPAKGTLPDPALLDGSTMPQEKKNENGMLGDFEMPGDENVRNGKVGGPQQQNPQMQMPNGQQMPMGMPQMGGGGGQPPQGQQPPPQGAQAAGGGPQQQQQGQPPQGAGGPPGGPSDPNAKAEGMQVGQLQTDPNAGGAGEAAGAQKPQQVSIGDSAMQIKGVANAPSVIGAQAPAGQTQQMEKGVGGGKSGSSQGGRNANERGQTMPSGL